jgi:hypothetical protein
MHNNFKSLRFLFNDAHSISSWDSLISSPIHLDCLRNPMQPIRRKRFSAERIIALHRRFVEVQISNGIETHCGSSWTVHRKQFPLRAAYATTFYGSQGLTLRRAILDLRSDPFPHGYIPHSSEYGAVTISEYYFFQVMKIKILRTLYIKDSCCSFVIIMNCYNTKDSYRNE